ncbi:hypothetical protein [Streptomyces sp. NBC_01438]|uniref:hypothetical protein n=1 Tax=Streptomyces sp. NBC_01438 TaxID=2903866 RepID=UPI00324C19C8
MLNADDLPEDFGTASPRRAWAPVFIPDRLRHVPFWADGRCPEHAKHRSFNVPDAAERRVLAGASDHGARGRVPVVRTILLCIAGATVVIAVCASVL